MTRPEIVEDHNFLVDKKLLLQKNVTSNYYPITKVNIEQCFFKLRMKKKFNTRQFS